jgi:hypothetical protein
LVATPFTYTAAIATLDPGLAAICVGFGAAKQRCCLVLDATAVCMGIASQKRKTRSRVLRERSTTCEGPYRRKPRLSRLEELRRLCTLGPRSYKMPRSKDTAFKKPPPPPSLEVRKKLQRLGDAEVKSYKFLIPDRDPAKRGWYYRKDNQTDKVLKSFFCRRCKEKGNSTYHKPHEIFCPESDYHDLTYTEVMEKWRLKSEQHPPKYGPIGQQSTGFRNAAPKKQPAAGKKQSKATASTASKEQPTIAPVFEWARKAKAKVDVCKKSPTPVSIQPMPTAKQAPVAAAKPVRNPYAKPKQPPPQSIPEAVAPKTAPPTDVPLPAVAPKDVLPQTVPATGCVPATVVPPSTSPSTNTEDDSAVPVIFPRASDLASRGAASTSVLPVSESAESLKAAIHDFIANESGRPCWKSVPVPVPIIAIFRCLHMKCPVFVCVLWPSV